MSKCAEISKLILSLKEQEDQKDIMKCVKLMLEKGCSINDVMKTAIDENRIDFVDSVIKIDPSIISYKDEKQVTYLHTEY